ncbi:MAG: 1-acyl-sn-glycerol-3-phosphate acyltransferase [Bacteroidetes bacterium]|nr:1-acyl-sn-glycerol-3-phosphate acyltransferase [Bacteroidota bacterium]MCB0844337.1 1-acyl-sn-glycerol-3-phosphate acyltransferase [Bacteroidota bacterium]
MILYTILKFLVKIGIRVFFRKIVVHGWENRPSEGPLIIAVNHPNTLMDPLLVAVMMKQRVGFLANASLFANKLVNQLFAILHTIPVYRKQDVAPGEPIDNDETFGKVYEYLDKNGTIMIFPEGTSFSEMKLRKIKTGTARIALGYEKQQQFQRNTQILTVALNYSEPTRFRSKVEITFNPPIPISEYQEKYAQDDFQTVRELTDRIRHELAEDLIITEDKDQEELLKRINTIYKEFLTQKLSLSRDSAIEFTILKELANGMRFLKGKDEGLYLQIEKETNEYFDLLETHELNDHMITSQGIRKLTIVRKFFNVISLFLFFPLYFLGVITNYLPYWLPARIAGAITDEIEYRAPIMMVSGIFLFPLFYLVETLLFHHFLALHPWHTLGFVLLLPISGFMALGYMDNLTWFTHRLKMEIAALQNPELIQQLVAEKGEILEMLESVRRIYEER